MQIWSRLISKILKKESAINTQNTPDRINLNIKYQRVTRFVETPGFQTEGGLDLVSPILTKYGFIRSAVK